MASLTCKQCRNPFLHARAPSAAGPKPATLVARQSTHRPAPRHVALAASSDAETAATQEVNLDDEVERFMKKQAELESGAAFAGTKEPSVVLGADTISEEEAKGYARNVLELLRTLKANRDMTVNEIRLVLSIEDPRIRERRGSLDIEDERGVSRDEMAAALLDVAQGRLPADRLALKCVWDEMSQWPYLDEATPSEGGSGGAAAAANAPKGGYAALTDDGNVAYPYIMGKDARAGDKPQTLEDLLPSWVGYVTLYGVSAIPVIIGAVVVLLLWNSQFR